jgi:hypothetical protein
VAIQHGEDSGLELIKQILNAISFQMHSFKVVSVAVDLDAIWSG